MNISISDKLLYLGAGCGIGLVVGTLFAPRSGRETREDLSNKMTDLTHQVQDKIQSSGVADSANQTWQSVVEKGKNVAAIGRRRFNESVEAARNKFNESMETEDFSER